MFFLQKFIEPVGGKKEEFSFLVGGVDSVVIFPLTKNKEVVAIRQFRHAAGKIFIELPGGNKESRELSSSAARRELLEETGFKGQKIVKLNANKIWFDPSTIRNYYIPYVFTGCYKASNPKLDNNERIETVVIPLNRWLSMIYNGEITDGKTLAVTFLALSRIGIKFKKF